MCHVCKLGHVTRYGQKILENVPPKMGTVYIDSSLTLLVPDMYKGQKKLILCLEIVEFFVICENKQSFELVPIPPIKSVDVFVAIILVTSKLPSVEMMYVILFTV